MTTIAWDGKTLAGDGQLNSGNTRVDSTKKKIYSLSGEFRGEKLLAIGLAGTIEYWEEIIVKVLDNDNNIAYSEDVSSILITDKSTWTLGEKGFYKINGKIAIGSGERYAYAALTLGLDAIAAVKLAAKLDVYTGTKVYSLKVK